MDNKTASEYQIVGLILTKYVYLKEFVVANAKVSKNQSRNRKAWLFCFSYFNFSSIHYDVIFSHSWKAVSEDEEADFNYLEQEIHTNSSTKLYTVEHLQPYTVYSFQVAAVNHVGRSRPSKNSYPSITLRESKFSSQEYNIYHSGLFG